MLDKCKAGIRRNCRLVREQNIVYSCPKDKYSRTYEAGDKMHYESVLASPSFYLLQHKKVVRNFQLRQSSGKQNNFFTLILIFRRTGKRYCNPLIILNYNYFPVCFASCSTGVPLILIAVQKYLFCS